MLIDWALSSVGAGPSGHLLEVKDVEIKDLGLVESRKDDQLVEQGEEASSSSHPGEGILLNNSWYSVSEVDLGKLRYWFKIPKSMEIRAPKAHERVDWVMLGWVALYEIPFRDGMRLPSQSWLGMCLTISRLHPTS